MATCQECGVTRRRKLFEDPRDPPIDDEPCLCKDCYLAALDDEIEAARSRIFTLMSMRRENTA